MDAAIREHESLAARIRNWLPGLTRGRHPEALPVTLDRNRVYIVPTRAGLGFAVLLATMLVAFFLNGFVSVVGVMGGYVFNVLLQDGTPGSYLASFTALAQLPDLYIGLVKALVFGLIAAIVASYKGMNAGGGPKGVGDAVNESVVITFMLLFVVNFVMSAIYFQLVPPKTG